MKAVYIFQSMYIMRVIIDFLIFLFLLLYIWSERPLSPFPIEKLGPALNPTLGDE